MSEGVEVRISAAQYAAFEALVNRARAWGYDVESVIEEALARWEEALCRGPYKKEQP